MEKFEGFENAIIPLDRTLGMKVRYEHNEGLLLTGIGGHTYFLHLIL